LPVISALKELSLEVMPRSPFRLDLTAWALKRRPENAVDLWDGRTYRRALVIDGTAVQLALQMSGSRLLQVTAQRPQGLPAVPEAVSRFLQHSLGIDTDLKPFYRVAETSTELAPLARKFRGLKPVRFPTLFEAFVNAIVCQQLSLHVGIMLLNRLTERCGLQSAGSAKLRAFPRPEDIAGLRAASLRALGLNHNKARALKEISQAFLDQELDPEQLSALPDQELHDRLLAIRGIGPWSARYIMLRGLGRLSMFPLTDVGTRNILAEYLNAQDLTEQQLAKIVDRWTPYAGFLYFHLLLHKLSSSGKLL